MTSKRSVSLRSVSFSLYLIVPLAIFAISAAAPAVTQAPVGLWPFDDGSGTKAMDASGNAHTATLVNGVSWVPGKIGGAVSANAALKEYVDIPAIDLSKTHAVTITLWSKRRYSTAGGHALFEATRDYTQSTTGFGFFPDDSTCGGIRAALRGNIGQTANCYDQPTSGVWHHLAIVYDKTKTAGDQVAFYVDGALQDPTRSLHASTNTNSFGENPIYLFSQGGIGMFDTGKIDDVRLFARALTAAQIRQIYNFGARQISEDVVVSRDSYGTMTTPSFTTSVNGELLVAFVAYDGPPNSGQTASVNGGGLSWKLRARSNKQWGTSEIWSATAPNAPFTITVTSQPGWGSNWHGSLTVVGFTNASGTGKVGQASARSGFPNVSLDGISAGNWVFAVGNDWDNPVARTPIIGQRLVHHRVDTQVGDTYWVQSTGAPSTVNTSVDILDIAPTADRWNYAAVEIVSANSKNRGVLTPSPASLSFGSDPVGSSTSQKLTLTNTGNKPVTVSGVSISGTGFSLPLVSTSFTLAANTSKQLTVTFDPTVAGNTSGVIAVTSNASDPNLNIPLSGTGIAPGPLTANPSTVSFGNVTVNSSSAQTVTLTNTAGISVTVSGLSISGTGFSLAQVSTSFTLAAGATKSLTVTFSPIDAGNASGSITVTSNATNPSLSIPVSGTGVTATTHSVTLSWTASTSQVAGYNCYRSTSPSGPFSVLNSSLISSTSFVDHAVQGESTYYYYVTAVDSLGNESMPSNHVSATIP